MKIMSCDYCGRDCGLGFSACKRQHHAAMLRRLKATDKRVHFVYANLEAIADIEPTARGHLCEIFRTDSLMSVARKLTSK